MKLSLFLSRLVCSGLTTPQRDKFFTYCHCIRDLSVLQCCRIFYLKLLFYSKDTDVDCCLDTWGEPNVTRYILSLSFTHKHTHARAHAQTHTLTHTHSHTLTHRYTHSHTQIHTHTHTHIYTHRYTQTHTHRYTNSHTDTHKHTHSLTHAHTYTHSHTHRYTHSYTHTQTHILWLWGFPSRRLIFMPVENLPQKQKL